MAELIEYAQMALNVYAASVRNAADLPVESGWTRIDWQPDIISGFSAGAFQRGDEIVISYTGTNDLADKLNWSIGLATPAPQIFDAVTYYLKIKAAHPEATITFTGHSLGGGLASLMAVFFDKPATTFDEAPFQLAALNSFVIAEVGALLAAQLAYEPAFIAYAASGGLLALSREYNVSHYAIDGEALDYPRLPMLTLIGADHTISKGESTAGAVELHSMTLLTAALESPNFLEVVQKLPSLVSELLDVNLFFADTGNETKRDLLRHLLRHQFGANGVTADAMLDRFGADFYALTRFGTEAANSAIAKAMTAVGLQHYYQQNATQEKFFTQLENGIQFDLTKPLGDDNTDLDSILGYEKLLEAARPMAPWETASSYPQPWEADLATQKSRLKELAAALQEGRSQRTTLFAETKRIALDSLNEAEQKVTGHGQELIKAESRGKLMTLTAPVDGTVQQLAVHTVGGVVTEAQQLLMVVPKDNPIEIEAFVENKDIGFVNAGQAAVVKIETFPFTKYGTIDAKVASVSSDAVNDEKRGLIFPARVVPARSTLRVENKTVQLSPGMAVTVEVKTARRRIIEYFLAPLLQYQDESLRER